jgi:hypothetical protein
MTTQQMLLLAMSVYLALLAATYFTRATRRRFLGALACGLVIAGYPKGHIQRQSFVQGPFLEQIE